MDRNDQSGLPFYNGKPLKVGNELEVFIRDIGKAGDGIAKINKGYVIFVQGNTTQVGDKVRIKLKQVGYKFSFASIVEYIGVKK